MAIRDPNAPRYRTFDPTVLAGKGERGRTLERPEDGSLVRPEDGPRIFDPAVLSPEESPLDESQFLSEGPLDSAVRLLTWGVLAVCLAVWAVLGFLLWVPLLIRAILGFSLSLSQSMLVGSRPEEAGRILMDSVGFYRRGFSVAVDAIRGRQRGEERPARQRLSGTDLVFEIVWAGVVWYLVLATIGIIEPSPVDLWNSAVGLLTDGMRGLDNLLTGGATSAPQGTEIVSPDLSRDAIV